METIRFRIPSVGKIESSRSFWHGIVKESFESGCNENFQINEDASDIDASMESLTDKLCEDPDFKEIMSRLFVQAYDKAVAKKIGMTDGTCGMDFDSCSGDD